MPRRHKPELRLSKKELNRGFVLRSDVRCAKYFRIGEIRRAVDKNGRSHSVKIKITYIEITPKIKLGKIEFVNLEGYCVVNTRNKK